MKITQVRNATIIVEFDKNKFLIDPWLGPKDYMEGFEAGINSHIRQPRVELPFEIQQIVDVDAVILTHFHPDHFDEYAVNALNKDIKFFVQSQTDLEIIQSYGFKNIEIITEDGITYKNIKLYKAAIGFIDSFQKIWRHTNSVILDLDMNSDVIFSFGRCFFRKG